MEIQSLSTCLEIYNKCLTFDFIAILLNETIEEPSMANVRSQLRILDHPLIRQPILKTSSPSLTRTKSRFFKLSRLQQPGIELSPLRLKEEDTGTTLSANYFDNAFLTYQQQKISRYFQLPQAWSKYVEDPETILVLFYTVEIFIN